jgi:hypothetical protein
VNQVAADKICYGWPNNFTVIKFVYEKVENKYFY